MLGANSPCPSDASPADGKEASYKLGLIFDADGSIKFMTFVMLWSER